MKRLDKQSLAKDLLASASSPSEKAEIVRQIARQHQEGLARLPFPDRIPTKGDGPDLSGSDLADVDLRGVDLHCADLTDSNLTNANLDGVRFGSAVLTKATLSGANLRGCSFYQQADFEGADLRGAEMQGADLCGANFTGSNLERANLQDASLSMAIFSGAKLARADFEGAWLGTADFRGAGLFEANLRRTHLVGSHFEGAHIMNADFREADMKSAHLQGAKLDSCRLEGADLMDADLKGVSLYRSRLDKTRLQHRQLGGRVGEEVSRSFVLGQYSYLVLKQNFGSLADNAGESWAYRRERRMEKRVALESAVTAFRSRKLLMGIMQCFKFCGDLAVELLCDYGESVWRVAAWIVALVLVIGPIGIALAGGLDTGFAYLRQHAVGPLKPWGSWSDYFQYLRSKRIHQ